MKSYEIIKTEKLGFCNEEIVAKSSTNVLNLTCSEMNPFFHLSSKNYFKDLYFDSSYYLSSKEVSDSSDKMPVCEMLDEDSYRFGNSSALLV